MAADPGCCSSRAHRLDGIRRPSRTPLTETSQQAPGCELPVKARAYHATVDVAQTPTFAGVGSCWEAPREERRSPLGPFARRAGRHSIEYSNERLRIHLPNTERTGREADREESRQSGMTRKNARS